MLCLHSQALVLQKWKKIQSTLRKNDSIMWPFFPIVFSEDLEGHALETFHRSHWEIPAMQRPLQDIYFPVLCSVCPADGISHPLRGEILWLINCQQFITSEELLNFLLWSHKTCQRLIRSQRITACFCSCPPRVQVHANITSASASDPHVQIRIIMCLLCSESAEGCML